MRTRIRPKKEEEEKELKVSFFSKNPITCPACGAKFRKEDILSGGGRMIAGSLTEELHRLYEPSVKYGEVYPLAYNSTVCPECWFASTEADFPLLPDFKVEAVNADQERRKADTLLILPKTDFTEPRGLMEAAASQYLTMRCYDFYTKHNSPTIKQGIAALRTAWFFDELNKKYPRQHYDWLAILFRKKAQYFYNEALEREQKQIETMSSMKSFGPDIDKNYSYEGMLYIYAYLCFKYGPDQGSEDRRATLESARRTIAKLFGMGKKSKDKPGAFLDLARKVYNAINEELGVGDV
jgi:uncharacterized protein (DUF2225 family)